MFDLAPPARERERDQCLTEKGDEESSVSDREREPEQCPTMPALRREHVANPQRATGGGGGHELDGHVPDLAPPARETERDQCLTEKGDG